MAKRYVRLNWQNKPSIATPISAINLNIMDKGIDDLDLSKVDTDAIVNNGVTTVAGTVLDGRMGKTLTDGLTAINNNLARYKSAIFTDVHANITINADYSCIVYDTRTASVCVYFTVNTAIADTWQILFTLPLPSNARMSIFRESNGCRLILSDVSKNVSNHTPLPIGIYTFTAYVPLI